MTDDTAAPAPSESAPPGRSLRERLAARGAHRHSRLSGLSRYLLAHQAEIAALLRADGYAWADIAALLAEEENLTDETGKPVTALAARLAWSRLRRRGAPLPAARAAAEPAPEDVVDQNDVSGAEKSLSFAAGAPPPLPVRPARPLSGPAPGQQDQGVPETPAETPPARRDDLLTRLLAAQNLPPPKVL